MKTRTKTRTIPKTPFFAAFSVGAVLFSAHAGGGFATGNQANTYYVGLGWAGIVSAIVAMLLLTLTMREAMIMYNSRGLTSYKQLFETLYHPFDKIEWLFEIFFYIMVLMAVAAAISGAASALRSYFGVNYYLGCRGRRLPRAAPDHFRRRHRACGVHLYGHRHPRHCHYHLRRRHFQERVAAVHGAFRGLPNDRLCQRPQGHL